jgi:hypothetical protein
MLSRIFFPHLFQGVIYTKCGIILPEEESKIGQNDPKIDRT